MGSKRKKGIWACEDQVQEKSLSVLTREYQHHRGGFLKDSGCPTPTSRRSHEWQIRVSYDPRTRRTETECGVVNGALVGREEEQSKSVVGDPGITEGLWASSIASVSTLRTP